ncbi:MAG: MFS transporter, partial [Coriobacteriales bacterium]
MSENTQPQYQNWAKVGLCVLMVGVSMALVQYKVPTIMLALMEQYSMSAGTASWLMSILCLLMIPLAIPSGFLCAKIGPRKCIALAAGVMVAGTLIGAFTSSTALLMVDRALEGAAICMLTVCGPVLIGAAVDPARNGSAMGFWGAWGPLGSAAAALATPTVYAACGTTGLWLSYTGVMVAFTVIMMVAVHEPRCATALADAAAGAGAKPSLRMVFTRDTVLFFVGFAAFNVVLLAVLSFVPTILQNKGMEPTMSGFVSTLPMILSVISCPLF